MSRIRTRKLGEYLSLVFEQQNHVDGIIAFDGNAGLFSANYPFNDLEIGASTTGIDISAVVGTGISITGNTGIALKVDSTGARGIRIHTHGGVGGEDYANEFMGDFVATTGITDGLKLQFIMQPATDTTDGVMRSLISNAYLPAGVAITGAAATGSMIAGGVFGCLLSAGACQLNGTAVIAHALWAKINIAVDTLMTSCKHVAAFTATAAMLKAPTLGIASIIHMRQEASGCQLQQAIYLEGTAYCDSFVTFDAAGAGDTAVVASAVAIGSASENTALAIKIQVGTDTYYIPAWANQNFTA